MSHKGADDLSTVIDSWLAHSHVGRGEGLDEVVETLASGLATVSDQAARERVRRRLAGVSPRIKPTQEILLERALDEVNRLQHRVADEDYVPWTAVATAAVVVAVALGLAIWLRRQDARTETATP